MYPDGPLYLEEAMKITKGLEKEELADFIASNEWLKTWKQIYGMIEKRLCGEAKEVFTTKVQAWFYRLPELC